MDIKDFIINDRADWNLDMVSKLKRFPIVMHSDRRKGTGLHVHPGLEIHVTLEGTGTMVVGKQVLLQSPRSVLVFRGMVPHQMISKSSYKRTVVSVNFGIEDADMMTSFHRLVDFSWIPADSCLSLSLSLSEFRQMEEMCGALQNELTERKIGWERMALSHVLHITVFLQRSAQDSESATTLPSASSGRKNDLVQLCSDYVCRNLGDDLSLKTVARQFAVSEEHLTRCFTREMDISFYQYVLFQRIAEAKRLLRESPHASISDIAYLIGFTSTSHFSRHFKTLTEETPSSYRHRMFDKGHADDSQPDASENRSTIG
ncbi:MAG: hypothetical protein K0Q59_4889 [Paenibacillus sp.]|jgi:AraC-like DNA-binding protein|nr:hypothetical protein [Paenibacillus sp.]